MFKYVLYLLFILLLLTRAVQAKNITVLTHFINPFVYQENGEIKGFAIDIVTEILKAKGNDEAFKVYPFKRGLRIVQSTPDHMLFIVARRPEREKTVKWVGPIITSGVYFYKIKGNPIKANSLEDVKNLGKIAVHRGNADYFFLKELGFNNLMETSDQMHSIQMLDRGRAEVTPVSELVMPEIAKEAGIDIENIERINVKLYESMLYIAFSKNISDKIISEWQQELDYLKNSGKYQEIYKKYL